MKRIFDYLKKAAANLNPLQLLNLVLMAILGVLGFLVGVVCHVKGAGLWEVAAATLWLTFCLAGIAALVVGIVSGVVFIAKVLHGPDMDRLLTRTASCLVILT